MCLAFISNQQSRGSVAAGILNFLVAFMYGTKSVPRHSQSYQWPLESFRPMLKLFKFRPNNMWNDKAVCLIKNWSLCSLYHFLLVLSLQLLTV